jgi:hypothetical protein
MAVAIGLQQLTFAHPTNPQQLILHTRLQSNLDSMIKENSQIVKLMATF